MSTASEHGYRRFPRAHPKCRTLTTPEAALCRFGTAEGLVACPRPLESIRGVLIDGNAANPVPSGVALSLLVAGPWIVRNIPMAAAATGTAAARARDCRVFMPVSSMLIDVPDDAWVMLPAQLGGTSRAIGLGASPPVVGICRDFLFRQTQSRD